MRPDKWWDPGFDDAAKHVWQVGHHLYETQGAIRRDYADAALVLYSGNARDSLTGMGSVSAEIDILAGLVGADPPAYNVIQACVDTKVAHMVSNKVRPFFLTERGSAELKERALAMQRAVEAVFEQNDLWGIEGTKVCYDGNLFDCGCYKGWPDYTNMRYRLQRAFPWEFFVDERDARYGHPQQLFHAQLIDREVLSGTFPEDDDRIQTLIHDAQACSADELEENIDDDGTIADQLMVIETWHLPSRVVDRSKPEAFGRASNGNEVTSAHDGRRMLCLQSGQLLLEAWPYDYFPVPMFLPQPRTRGYWSRGLPEILAGNQNALNRMAKRIDGIMDLHARPLVYVWRQAKINTRLINNNWGTIIEGNAPPGQAMQYITPQSVPGDYLRRYREIIEDSERQAGISGLSIAAEKPAGVEHAPALQHIADTESLRRTPEFRSWERMHVTAARCVVDGLRLLTEYAKDHEIDFSLLWGDSKQLKRLKSSDWDIEENRYQLKVWPTNLLPQTPAAKISRIMSLIESGILSAQKAAQALALSYPDIEALFQDATAAERNIDERMKNLVAGQSFEMNQPEPYMDLEMAKTMALDRINKLEADGYRDKRVDALREFFEQAQKLATEAQAAAQPPSPPPGPPSPGVPVPVPAAQPVAPPTPTPVGVTEAA